MICNLIKRIRCKHDSLEFIRNVHGDEINYLSNYKRTVRSIWKCKKCGKIIYSSNLNTEYD